MNNQIKKAINNGTRLSECDKKYLQEVMEKLNWAALEEREDAAHCDWDGTLQSYADSIWSILTKANYPDVENEDGNNTTPEMKIVLQEIQESIDNDFSCNNLEIEIMFDNGGGATAKFGEDYIHFYQDMKQLANSYKEYLLDNDTEDWEGNEIDEGYWKNYNRKMTESGAALWLDYSEICKLIANLKDNNSNYWGLNVKEFITALVK